ncbi:MAG: hypothetical protein U1C46_10950 [Bacteroidales bacterium]|nr:hypothetical protein [Bacteroidales bacterium]
MKRIQVFWKSIKNEKSIIFTLLGLILIGVLFLVTSKKTEDFGLNFFTEMLGVTVTVFIIDRLIQKREEKRNIPQKLAEYEDIRLFTSFYIRFWTDTYRESVPDPDPETIEDFFSNKGMPKILNYLYMDSEPDALPPQKWYDWLVFHTIEFQKRGKKIIDRHSNNLDPIVFGLIHQLTESQFNKVLSTMPSIRQTDISMNFTRIKVLGSYSMQPLNEDFEAILGLVNWCNHSFLILQKHNKSIKKVIEYKANRDRKMPPKFMIPPEILKQQADELHKFRQQAK